AWGLNAPLPDWAARLRFGGNAAVRAMGGQRRAGLERNNGLSVNQAGLVLDADVAQDVSFWYDFDLVREGAARRNEQIYIRWDNISGRGWLNAKLGRAFMPFGEEYLRWDAVDNWFASPTVAFPWAQDEGVVFFGDVLPEGLLSYAAAVQNGNNTFNLDDNVNKTFSGRLSTRPAPWFYASASYLNLGRQGNPAAADAASKEVDAQGFEGNVRLTWPERGEAWVNYGRLMVRDGGGSDRNRTIQYGALELKAHIPKTEQKGYVAARYSVVGTFKTDQGYRFAGTELAFAANNSAPYGDFSYDQRSLWRASLAAGRWFRPNVLGKLEYSWEDTTLIEPAKSPAAQSARGQRNFFIAELAVRF
ncbi:MAG: hypothetical protein FD126_1507, partial [Elusimicrobia bacterium]